MLEGKGEGRNSKVEESAMVSPIHKRYIYATQKYNRQYTHPHTGGYYIEVYLQVLLLLREDCCWCLWCLFDGLPTPRYPLQLVAPQ